MSIIRQALVPGAYNNRMLPQPVEIPNSTKVYFHSLIGEKSQKGRGGESGDEERENIGLGGNRTPIR